MSLSFTEILNLSISASSLVLGVVVIRHLLKGAPKAFHCCLWALVAIRLLIPFSIESELSLVPSREVIPQNYLTMEPSQYQAPARLEIVSNPVYESDMTIELDTTVDRVQNWDLYATLLWWTGMGAMAIYAAYSYLSLRLRVRMAGWVRGNIWECDGLESPFILGLLRPRIYLPSDLDEETKAHVLAHEQAHLKRLDHIWKPLGFALLTVHWFNPVIWLAYLLLCRDIELACDEKVIKKLDKPAVQAYSEALVQCTVSHRSVALCPLAFGEIGVKARIKTMLHYKKPAFWVLAAAILAAVTLAVCFLTDPAKEPVTIDHIRDQDGYTIQAETMVQPTLTIPKDRLPQNILNGQVHSFKTQEIIVWQKDDTVIWLESARTRGNGLSLTFSLSHNISDQGAVYLRESLLDPDDLMMLTEKDGGVRTDSQYYANACHVYSSATDTFSMHVDMEVYKDLPDRFYLDLINLYRITYRAEDLGTPTPDEQLQAILNQDGYAVTETVSEELGLMFYIHWLPEECFEPEGYTFREGELTLYESETTAVDLMRVCPLESQLRFDFRFRYELPEAGTILLPCHVNIKGTNYNMRVGDRVHDFSKDYPDQVTLIQEKDTMAFSLLMDQQMVQNADDYLSITLNNVWETSYVPTGVTIQDQNLYPEDVLYRNPNYTGIPAANVYVLGYDLHLTALEAGGRWDIRRDLGSMTAIELQEDTFDKLFNSRYFTASFSPAKLRDKNLRAWSCQEMGLNHLLLQQKDGSVYLAVLREDGAALSDFCELRLGDSAAQAPEVISHSYTLQDAELFDRPHFSLYSDGTFCYSESMVSSYLGHGWYTLDANELVMKTEDGRLTLTFLCDGNGFRYDADRSSPVLCWVHPRDTKPLPDGALFVPEGIYQNSSTTLEDLVSEAIIGHNWQQEDEGMICVESHEILGELVACGAATADGVPAGYTTVYLTGEYRTYRPEGETVYRERIVRFSATVTLAQTTTGYTVTEYVQAEKAKDIFPEHILEIHQERWPILNDRLSAENSEKARIRNYQRLGLVTDVAQLLDIICSEPSPYSNPGAYIDMHPEEFNKLIILNRQTIAYCFGEFAKGNQMDLRGHIMALACQEISGDHATVENAMTGQAWFNQFAAIAEDHRAKTSAEKFENNHPWCFMALDILGI